MAFPLSATTGKARVKRPERKQLEWSPLAIEADFTSKSSLGPIDTFREPARRLRLGIRGELRCAAQWAGGQNTGCQLFGGTDGPTHLAAP